MALEEDLRRYMVCMQIHPIDNRCYYNLFVQRYCSRCSLCRYSLHCPKHNLELNRSPLSLLQLQHRHARSLLRYS